MKAQEDKLTLQETEELCRLYMDCKLSVFEETELGYFLTQVDYHTPLIDEVRRLMAVDAYISDKVFTKTDNPGKGLFKKWRFPLSAAASIAVIFSICLMFLQNYSTLANSDQSYYVAYVEGKRLSGESARLKVEAEKKSVDDFIKEMSALEAHEQQMIDKFFNL
ncbi:MAG: hypothetical protein K2J48_06430 [Muribaculaceae bacterium]|nr:hypothetical protein [Muribaculaceae bacterium]